jgi:hypothetical protein
MLLKYLFFENKIFYLLSHSNTEPLNQNASEQIMEK